MPSVTLLVKPAVANSLRATLLHGSEPSNHEHKQLDQLIKELGIALEPVAATEQDLSLKGFFHAQVPALSVQSVTDRLREAAGVESVFVKPDATPP